MELKFKPLSEGLGFHSFSNGLPYAPAHTPVSAPNAGPKTSQPGTGAVSAGRPSFAFPSKPATPSVAVAAPAATLILERDLGWDYLGRRFFAYIADSMINIFLGALTLAGSLWNQRISTEFFFNQGVFFLVIAFLLFFNWSLITAQEIAFGTTLGKRFFGLSIRGTAVGTLIRAVLFIPSSLLLGLGVIWSMIDHDSRGVHDLISGIQPEED